MADPATLKHLRAWLLKEVEDEDRRDRVEAAMLAVVSEDPEYWGGKTWREVYEQIGGHGFSGYKQEKFFNPYTVGALLLGTWVGSKLLR